MIRVYLDWGVISNLKNEEFSEFQQFILQHKNIFQFPYTPAHFKDLMKSYSPENENFYRDLENIEQLSERHLLRWGTKGIEVLFATPREYFENEKESEDAFEAMDIEKIFNDLNNDDLGFGEFGDLMKSLYQSIPSGIDVNEENQEILKNMFPNIDNSSSMWDLMKDITPFSKNLLSNREYYKDFRKTLGEKGFKLDPNSGNWEIEDVFKNINDFLQKQNTNLTFTEYIDTCFKHKKEPVNRYEYYTTAYLLLDMIGYKPDKLPKTTDNMMNIQTDAEHSFYSAFCDYFVVLDKKLTIKTKVLFKEFNILTVVLTPQEFVEVLKDKIHSFNKEKNFIKEAFQLIKPENIVEQYQKDDVYEVDTYAFKLPLFYFNFFNYVVHYDYSDQKAIILEFKKIFKNYSSFIYYTESEKLLDNICEFFGYVDSEEHQTKRKEFIYEDKDVCFEWQFDYGMIILSKDLDTHRPILKYIIKISEN